MIWNPSYIPLQIIKKSDHLCWHGNHSIIVEIYEVFKTKNIW